jgi:ParB/RepB/Spo0J family partition protein
MTRTAENKTEEVVLLPLDKCHKSPSQPRKRGEKKPDDDFVKSIREKGVIQPIIVRVRKAGGWEIVFGHRRHTGSVMAKRQTIPAIVRDLTDDEVFELQMVENVHRQDMHPLDEADGFKRMVERGKTVQYIADKVSRPVTHVAQRLKLCELSKEGRDALDDEEISLGVAVLVARVPVALQAEALKSLYHGVSAAEAKRRLEATYLLRLDQAPFDVTDAKLVEKAGACTTCPKRTGQQRELFPDAARADLCVDRVCYRGKLDAVWQVRLREAKAGGTPVLEGKAAQSALGYGGGYKKLDDEDYVGGKYQKIRTFLGKKNRPPVSLAQDDRTGAIVELVRASDVAKLSKAAAPGRSDNPSSDNQKRQEEAQRRRAAAVSQVVMMAVEKLKVLSSAQVLRLLTHALVERSWNDVQMAVSWRRGLEDGKRGTGVEQRLLAYLKTLAAPAEVAGLGLELALRTIAPGKWNPAKPVWGETLKALGINFDAVEKKIAVEAKAKKAAKRSKKKTAA